MDDTSSHYYQGDSEAGALRRGIEEVARRRSGKEYEE
jgi:hypothetical protein